MGYNSKVKIENNYELFTIFWSFHFSYVLLHHSNGKCCCCSSVVEHFLGKEEVTSSILVNSSRNQAVAKTRQPLFSCTSGKKPGFGTIFRPNPDRSGRAPQTTQIQVYPHFRCAPSSDIRHAINRSGTINRKGGRELSHISGILLFRVRLRSFISKRALQYRIAQFTKRD